MNKKLLIGFATILLITSIGCQKNAQLPTVPSTPNSSSAASGQTDAASNTLGGATTQPAQPLETAPESTKIPEAQPTPAPGPTPTDILQAVPKLYKMNPKTYDIVPIDPAVTDKKVVLLTFDDGPKDKDMLDSLLGTLDKHKAKAIFFVNGYRVKQKPELIKLITVHDMVQWVFGLGNDRQEK
jgi:hypothetical protein